MQHSSFASTASLPRLLSAHTLKPRWLLFSFLFGVICSKTSAGGCVGDSARKADVGRIKSSLHSRIINHAISGHARKSLVAAEGFGFRRGRYVRSTTRASDELFESLSVSSVRGKISYYYVPPFSALCTSLIIVQYRRQIHAVSDAI